MVSSPMAPGAHLDEHAHLVKPTTWHPWQGSGSSRGLTADNVLHCRSPFFLA